MFWVGIVLAVFISELLSNISSLLSLLCIVLSILFVPSRLTKLNKVEYTKDKIFLNSQKENLKERLPTKFPVVLLINLIIFPIILSRYFNALNISVIIGLVLLLPTLYFVIINCPISILFNINAWTPEIAGWKLDENTTTGTKYNNIFDISNRSSSLRNFMHENPITDARWSGSSINIHNPNRKDFS